MYSMEALTAGSSLRPLARAEKPETASSRTRCAPQLSTVRKAHGVLSSPSVLMMVLPTPESATADRIKLAKLPVCRASASAPKSVVIDLGVQNEVNVDGSGCLLSWWCQRGWSVLFFIKTIVIYVCHRNFVYIGFDTTPRKTTAANAVHVGVRAFVLEAAPSIGQRKR